jgi:hypothetical protein
VGSRYLLFAYLTPQERFLGLVVGLRPETLTTAQAILTSWETADMESSFAALFLGGSPKRSGGSFETVPVNAVPFRRIGLRSSESGVEFGYGFYGTNLIITTNMDGARALLNLRPL